MLGQVSVEYLAVSLVAFSLLSISMLSLIYMHEGSSLALEAHMFRSSALRLGNAIDEVCALGEGNGREVSLGTGIEVSSVDGLLSLKGGNHSIVRSVRCETEQAGLYGIIYVENEGGKIRFRER